MEGTPVRKTVEPDSIIEGTDINPSIDAIEYARVFEEARKEEQKNKEDNEERE